MNDSQRSSPSTTPSGIRTGRPREKTLIVACEFTGSRFRMSNMPSVRLARESAHAASDSAQGSDSGHLANAKSADSIFEAASARAIECRELAEGAGADVLEIVTQRRDHPDPATLVGKGKLEEIAAIALARGVNLIIFERDLSPSQLRELERALPCRVIDRTQLILDIFASHARTREGQLQVELAQLEYMLPRLAGKGRSMSQLGGGIGTRGPGETQLETDRRKIGRRLQAVRERLERVRDIRRQQRQRRISAPVPAVALVGYTNAGKSTLFNALTSSGVVESSRMFATLDPKMCQMVLPSRRKILLSDTVGFIRDLPHTLINAFRATLEEVQMAEVLVHVMDASSASLSVHCQEVEKVLRELEVADKPRVEVLNKIDLLTPEERIEVEKRNQIMVSARRRDGLEELLAAIDAAFTSDPLREEEFLVPQSHGAALAALRAGAVISAQTFHDDAVRLRARGPVSLLEHYREYRVQDSIESFGGETELTSGNRAGRMSER